MNASSFTREKRGTILGTLIVEVALLLAGLPPSACAFDVFGTAAGVSSTPAGKFAVTDPTYSCQFGPPGVPLHLAEAVNRALCDNPKTREAWANVKMQAAAVGVAKSAYLPALNVDLQDGRDDATTDVKGYPRLSSANRSTLYSGSVSASWVLYDFGGRKAGLANAQALLAAARATQDTTLQTVFSTVATDYYAAQAAAGQLDLAKETEAIARDSFTAASARMTRGVAAISDQLQAETAWVQSTFDRVKAEGELQIALGTLAADMGLRPDQPVTMPEAEDGIEPDNAFAETVSAMIDDAQRTHPSIAAARAKLDAAIAAEQQSRSEGLPVFSLTGRYSQNNQPASLGLGEPRFPSTGRDWYLGVQLQIPLFEGFGRRYRIGGAHAQTELQRDLLDEARQQVGVDVWKSYRILQTDTENVTHTATLMRVTQRSFDVARHRYAAGVGNMLELLSVQKALSEARQQRIQALTGWRAARLQLAAKMGQLDTRTLGSHLSTDSVQKPVDNYPTTVPTP